MLQKQPGVLPFCGCGPRDGNPSDVELQLPCQAGQGHARGSSIEGLRVGGADFETSLR